MKLVIVSLFVLLLQINSANAFVKSGPCAGAAAKAARAYAAQEWNSVQSALKVVGSQQMSSSNPAPMEVYGVGVLSQSGAPVLFTVALNNDGRSCQIVDVSFAEYLE